jgi:hypothetical protein
VVVVTLDEEERIRRASNRSPGPTRIIVVDAESRDKTVAIARELTDHVIVRSWPGYAAQKNFGLEQARGNGSSRSTPTRSSRPSCMRRSRPSWREDDQHAGYAVPRRNIFWGRWVRYGGLYPDWQVRLLARGAGRFVERSVHESIRVDGSVARLQSHSSTVSYRDVADFLARADRYATLAADEWAAAGRRSRPFVDMVVRPIGRFSGCTSCGPASWTAGGDSFSPFSMDTMCSCDRPSCGRGRSADGDTGAGAVGDAPERAADTWGNYLGAWRTGSRCRTTTTASTSRRTGTC